MSTPTGEDGAKRPALGADLIIPILAGGSAIYFIADTRNLVWEARSNGTVIGVALLLLVAVQIARIALRVWSGRATLGLGPLSEWNEYQAQRAGLLGLLVLFVLTIPWLGTTLGLFLVMVSSMWVLGVRSPLALVGISFAVAATVYLLFMVLLQSRLPVGPIEVLLAPLFGR